MSSPAGSPAKLYYLRGWKGKCRRAQRARVTCRIGERNYAAGQPSSASCAAKVCPRWRRRRSGRGSLFGPVSRGAICVPCPIPGLRDSSCSNRRGRGTARSSATVARLRRASIDAFVIDRIISISFETGHATTIEQLRPRPIRCWSMPCGSNASAADAAITRRPSQAIARRPPARPRATPPCAPGMRCSHYVSDAKG